jgi:AmiR/NasT family two-component response regulator
MDPLDDRIVQLTLAVERRTVIGVALGMLMERFGFGQDDAFAYLRRCSQAQNRKLYEIAAEFTETRRLPEAGARPQSAEPSGSVLPG